MDKENQGAPASKKKRIIIIVVAAAIVVLLGGAGFAAWWLYGPSSHISLDVNPSVELEINRMGEVTAVKLVGEDAARLLAGYEMLDKDPSFVLGDIIDLFILGGFVTDETDNALLLTVSTGMSKELITELDDTIVAYYEYYELESEMYQQEIEFTTGLQQAAAAAGITTGKMAVVEKLETAGTATRDQLAAMSTQELVDFAARNNIDTGIYDLYEYYLENYLYEDGEFDISFGDWVWEDDSSGSYGDGDWMFDDSDISWYDDDSGWYWDDEDDSSWVWSDEDDSDWTEEDDSGWWDEDDGGDWADAEYGDEDDTSWTELDGDSNADAA